MSERTSPNVEVIDLAPSLWIWRLEHPAWNPHVDWQEVVTCTCVDAGGERWLLDPLLPPQRIGRGLAPALGLEGEDACPELLQAVRDGRRQRTNTGGRRAACSRSPLGPG